MADFLLASASPRRADLLRALCISFRVQPSDVDEVIRTGLSPDEVAIDIARQKGQSMHTALQQGEWLIAADTIVVHEGHILGKPTDKQDAVRMLTSLSGHTHQVITGVYVFDGERSEEFQVTTDVALFDLTADDIRDYVERDHPMDKAGSYGIQDWIGWAAVRSIRGSYSNVMGLPTAVLYQKLMHWSHT